MILLLAYYNNIVVVVVGPVEKWISPLNRLLIRKKLQVNSVGKSLAFSTFPQK